MTCRAAKEKIRGSGGRYSPDQFWPYSFPRAPRAIRLRHPATKTILRSAEILAPPPGAASQRALPARTRSRSAEFLKLDSQFRAAIEPSGSLRDGRAREARFHFEMGKLQHKLLRHSG